MSIFRRFACIALFGATALTVFAQELPMRMFPPSVKFATLRVAPNYEASLNKEVVRLSPGLRLFTPQNMMVLPNMIVNQPVKVAYTVDIQGFVQQAWILTDSEVQRVQPVDRGFFSFSSNPFQ